MMKNVLVLLAHQDDEYFAAPWIESEIKAGNTVAVLYFTDGGLRVPPAIRDAESQGVLQLLGVPPTHVAFLGDKQRIPDGQLVHHIVYAQALLKEWLTKHQFGVDRIYSPDYEGGHADHDAVYVLAVDLAQAFGIVHDSWSFALYNAFNCPRPMFRALRLLQRQGQKRLRYSIVQGWSYAMLCWRYRSQRRTWLGLFPESFFRRLFLRSESVNVLRPARLQDRPHESDLLYERMFGVRHADFSEAAKPLLERVCARGLESA